MFICYHPDPPNYDPESLNIPRLKNGNFICRQVGIMNVVNHSYLLNSGEPIYNVSKIVGHSATHITEFIYAHHVAENLVKSMEKMKQLIATSENDIL